MKEIWRWVDIQYLLNVYLIFLTVLVKKKKGFDDINSPLSTLVQCGNEGNMRVGGYIVAGGSLQCIQVKMEFIFILVFLQI